MDNIILFDLVWRSLVVLGTARTGTATGGSTTTIIDTNGLKNIDNRYYDKGTAFVLLDAAGAGAAPEKSFSRITKSDSISKTLTLETALTAIAVGDTYGVANGRYPLYHLIQEINNALYMDGYIPVDDTSLTTAANQTELTLPVGASRDLRAVLIQRNDDSDDNLWDDLFNWRIKFSATGSQDTLLLASQPPSGKTLLLRYATPHAELRVASDVLNEVVHPDRIVYQVAANSLRWYIDKTRQKTYNATLDMFELKAQRAKSQHPLPPLPLRQSRLTIVTRTLSID